MVQPGPSSQPASSTPGVPGEPARRRYKLTLAYDGHGFHGWQKQEPPGMVGGLRTVQGVVEKAARELLKQPVRVQGASRTDAGVHANGQVAQLDAATRIPVERLAQALNARLPGSIEVRDARFAPPTFDVRAAVTKQYRYRIWNTARRPLGVRHLVYHYWTPLDAAAMNDAAGRLVGEHDFASFAAAGHGRLSTVRTIHRCTVERPAGCEPQVHVLVEGSGFLYNMVRIIVGTLLEVGRGYWPPEKIGDILAARDRQAAGRTAPPQGLCLEWIRYE